MEINEKAPRTYALKDMVNLLEIKHEAKKLLHGPSL